MILFPRSLLLVTERDETVTKIFYKELWIIGTTKRSHFTFPTSSTSYWNFYVPSLRGIRIDRQDKTIFREMVRTGRIIRHRIGVCHYGIPLMTRRRYTNVKEKQIYLPFFTTHLEPFVYGNLLCFVYLSYHSHIQNLGFIWIST